MKKILVSTSLVCLSMLAIAQFPFKTGSVELDADLNRINTEAKLDFSAFKSELSVSFNIEAKRIEYFRTTVKMEPAEIFFALQIARISNKSADDVVNVYTDNKDKGWGYIAKQMGIKPGSPEFHQLKEKTKNKGSKKKNPKKANKGKGKKK